MNRGYSREEYIEKALMIQETIPGVCFSTDIIVGFPGETESQFEETLSLLDEVPYDSIFAFKYSPRPYTKAARWEDQLSELEKGKRLSTLFAHHEIIAAELSKKYEGLTLDVLVEEYHESDGRAFGRSTQNKVVHFKGHSSLVGQTVPVKVSQAYAQTLRGEMLSQ